MAFISIIRPMAEAIFTEVKRTKPTVDTIESTIKTFLLGDEKVVRTTTKSTSIPKSSAKNDDEKYIEKVKEAIDKLSDDSVYNVASGRAKKTVAAKKERNLVVIESLRIAGLESDRKFILVRDALSNDSTETGNDDSKEKDVKPVKQEEDPRMKYIEIFKKLKDNQVLNLDSMQGKDVVVAKKTLNVVSNVYMGFGVASKDEKLISSVLELFGVQKQSPANSLKTSKGWISMNDWDNYEHRETGIVFIALTKKGKTVYQAVGVQNKNADISQKGKLSILPLTEDTIEVVKEKGWLYDDTYVKTDVVTNTESDAKKVFKNELSKTVTTAPVDRDVFTFKGVKVTRKDFDTYTNLEDASMPVNELSKKTGISVEVLNVLSNPEAFDALVEKFTPEEEETLEEEDVVEDDS